MSICPTCPENPGEFGKNPRESIRIINLMISIWFEPQFFYLSISLTSRPPLPHLPTLHPCHPERPSPTIRPEVFRNSIITSGWTNSIRWIWLSLSFSLPPSLRPSLFLSLFLSSSFIFHFISFSFWFDLPLLTSQTMNIYELISDLHIYMCVCVYFKMDIELDLVWFEADEWGRLTLAGWPIR